MPTAASGGGDGVADKAELIRRAYRELAKLWEGRGDNFPWFTVELERIEEEADQLSYEELRDRLRQLYIQFKRAKEHTKQS
ncbi:MAG: hypothetical protein ABEK03_02170 [Candidatus Bipolaricaulia bacterium]